MPHKMETTCTKQVLTLIISVSVSEGFIVCVVGGDLHSNYYWGRGFLLGFCIQLEKIKHFMKLLDFFRNLFFK